jgi:hypothetical protein
MGLTRKKGRPRKFPGYLVREMRLSKNKAEYEDLLRQYEDEKGITQQREELRLLGVEHSGDQQHLGDEDEDDDEEEEQSRHHEGGYEWGHIDDIDGVHDDQTLLDVVDAAQQQLEQATGSQSHHQDTDLDMEHEPSGLGRSDQEMREVFGLHQ